MINAAPIKSAVKKAFDLVGEPMTLRRVTGPGTFDENTGEYSAPTVVDRSVVGINAGREQNLIAGTLVLNNDYAVYIYDDGGARPETNQLIIIGGDEMAIQSVTDYQLAGTKMAYRCVMSR